MISRYIRILKSGLTAALLISSTAFTLPAVANYSNSHSFNGARLHIGVNTTPYSYKEDFGSRKSYIGFKYFYGNKRLKRNRIFTGKKHFRHHNGFSNQRRGFGHYRHFNRGFGKYHRKHGKYHG